MARIRAFYSVNFGLEGCYMPDSFGGAVEINSRRALAQFIRDELRAYDLPQSLFRYVGVRRLWAFIKRHGSSTAHFTIGHNGNALRFIGLTEYEYQCEQEKEF